MNNGAPLICRISELSQADGAIVGGKNASLGEMIGKLKDEGISVPHGFATTDEAEARALAAKIARTAWAIVIRPGAPCARRYPAVA